MKWRFVTCCLLSLLLLAPAVLGQTTRGILTGVVSDSSGGRIPGAQVTAVKADTGTTYTTVTSDDGNYALPELPYGEYTVSIALSGFTTAQAKVIISANQTTRLDPTLQVGGVTEAIQVEATPAVRPDSVTVESNFSTKQILDLPLAIGAVGNSRSPETFTFLTPGVSGDTFLTRVNGGQRFSNDVLVDGASTYRSENGPAFDETAPSVESLGEFTIKTNTFSAEYGATGSAITSFAYKSGTNGLHGSVYDFVRRTPLDAAGFYNTGRCTINGQKVTDSSRCNDPTQNPERRPALDQKNDYGFSVGGPVYLPGVYNGKDKTFWFMSLERYDQANQFSVNPVHFPTVKQLAGDFSELLNRPSPVVIYDPQTGQPFQGNIIPQDRISPVSRYALQFFPQPNTVNPATGLTEWFVNAVPLQLNSTLLTWTGDHSINDFHKLHASLSYRKNFRTRDPDNLLPGDNPLTQERQQDFRTQYARISYDWTLNPTLLNHMNIGFNRTWSNNGTVTVGRNFVLNSGLQGVANTHTPTQDIVGYATLGNQEFNTNIDNSYQLGDDISWIRGNHNFKFGVSLQRQHYNPKTQNNGAGTWHFTPDATSSLTGQGGDAFASYLLGAVQGGEFWWNLVNPGWRRLYSAFYFQDDFKFRPNLTLNYGLRWEISDPRSEVENRTSSFNPALPNPAAGGIPGALDFASDSRPHFDKRSWHDLGPRLGLSYSFNNRTVLHTGFGIYYSKVFYGDFGERTKQGFDAQPNFASPDGHQPAFYWQNGVPARPRPPFLDPSFVNGQSIDYIIEDGSRPAQTYSWNFGIEREVVNNLVVNASYVGNSAQNLNRSFNYNQLPPQFLSLGDLLLKPIDDPAVAAAGFAAPYPTFTQDWGEGATLARALRPFPQYQDIIVQNMTDGHSTYHSLQFKAEKRWSNDLQFLVAYTLSKNLTNADSRLTWLSRGWQNDRLNRLEKSPSEDDRTHVLAISYIYDLPFGKGKKLLSGNGVTDRVFGGWQISGILQYQSGTPIGIGFGCPDIERVGAGGCRASYASGPNADLYGAGHGIKPDPNNGQVYINPAAFTAPAQFQYGTTERFISRLRGFPYKNENMSLFKNAQFTEQVGMQFRVEVFNMFNRVQFNNPDTFIGTFDTSQPGNIAANPNFGFYSGQRNQPRIVQLGLKLLF